MSPGFIASTLLVALFINMLPVEGLALALLPDAMALVLLYWCIHQPSSIGVGFGWLIGLVMDVASGVVFGQHALGYTVLAYLGVSMHRRVLRFTLWQQASHVLLILVASQLLNLLLGVIAKGSFSDWKQLLGSVSGAVLWPFLSVFMQQLAQRNQPAQDTL